MRPNESQNYSNHKIKSKEPDPNTRAGVINELSKTSWLRLHGLLDGMLNQASNDLFKEIRDADSGEWITRNFNSMRALMVWRESLVDDFRNLMAESWQQFDQSVSQPRTGIANDISEVINAYAQISQTSNQVVLIELDQVLNILSNGGAAPHPLTPYHLLRVFWRSTECMSITADERLVLLKLFDQSVLGKAALVWDSALDLMNTLVKKPHC